MMSDSERALKDPEMVDLCRNAQLLCALGTDLSPAYLRKANQLLSQIPGELPQLLQANAEELPYLDNYFHGVTCVFLFHELPPAVRQQVIEQCFRVTKPGGVFVICDSIQVSDSPDMKPVMESFPRRN